MLRHVALIRTDVSEEVGASFIRVTKISVLGTTLAVTSNRWKCQVRPKRRFLQEPHGITSQKTAFFIVTAVKTSSLYVTCLCSSHLPCSYLSNESISLTRCWWWSPCIWIWWSVALSRYWVLPRLVRTPTDVKVLLRSRASLMADQSRGIAQAWCPQSHVIFVWLKETDFPYGRGQLTVRCARSACCWCSRVWHNRGYGLLLLGGTALLVGLRALWICGKGFTAVCVAIAEVLWWGQPESHLACG
jgi:hypothetical protein